MKKLEDGFPAVPQAECFLLISTADDDRIKQAYFIVAEELRKVEEKINEIGIECKINFGLMTWDPRKEPLKTLYPWAYK